MTALKKYARLEAQGVWRLDENARRMDVNISLGDATLTITDLRTNSALAHWSLAAIERQAKGTTTMYNPDGDPSETLELGPEAGEMIEAIETLRKAIARARPRPGRLRWLGAAVSTLIVASIGVFWLPGALHSHALQVVPPVKRVEIGDALLARIARVGGAPCKAPGTETALRALAARTGVARLAILPSGVNETLLLPGGTLLLNRALVEDHEDPHVAAGYILAELARGDETDALSNLLSHAGLRGTSSLLTTGMLPEAILDAYAEETIAATREKVDQSALLERFEAARISTKPYAYAVDISGETTLGLIEADPMAAQSADPIMRDGDWLQLQAICAT